MWKSKAIFMFEVYKLKVYRSMNEVFDYLKTSECPKFKKTINFITKTYFHFKMRETLTSIKFIDI